MAAYIKKPLKRLLEKRSKLPYRLKIKEMDDKSRYIKLDSESKLFRNIIKMMFNK